MTTRTTTYGELVDTVQWHGYRPPPPVLSRTQREQLVRVRKRMDVLLKGTAGGRTTSAVSRARQRARRLAMATCYGRESFFWTATFRDNVTDYDSALRAWEAFRDRVTNLFGTFHYVAVPERQKRGAWHFHAVISGLPSREEMVKRFGLVRYETLGGRIRYYEAWLMHLREAWNRSCGSEPAEWFVVDTLFAGTPVYAVEGETNHRSQVDEVRSQGGVAWYVAKYLTKEVLNDIPRGRRAFFSRVPVRIEQTDVEVPYTPLMGKTFIEYASKRDANNNETIICRPVVTYQTGTKK